VSASAVCDPFSSISSNPVDPPAIAKGILEKSDWNDWKQGSRKITAALRSRFALGSSAQTMREELEREGFQLEPAIQCTDVFDAAGRKLKRDCSQIAQDKRRFLYNWGILPCVQTITVAWHADTSDRLTDISGTYGLGCL
jgi:hypothetical protein